MTDDGPVPRPVRVSVTECEHFAAYVRAGYPLDECLTMVGWMPTEGVPGKTGPVQRLEAEAYIDLVREGAQPSEAAKALGRKTSAQLTRFCNQDEGLREAFAEAWRDGAEPIVQAVERRAIDGYRQEVYQGGKLVGYKTIVIPTDAYFAVKARKPEYADSDKSDTQVQVQVNVEDRSARLDDMWRALTNVGVNPEVIAAGDSGGAPRRELPPAQDVLAEPAVVLGEASGVSGAPSS